MLLFELKFHFAKIPTKKNSTKDSKDFVLFSGRYFLVVVLEIKTYLFIKKMSDQDTGCCWCCFLKRRTLETQPIIKTQAETVTVDLKLDFPECFDKNRAILLRAGRLLRDNISSGSSGRIGSNVSSDSVYIIGSNEPVSLSHACFMYTDELSDALRRRPDVPSKDTLHSVFSTFDIKIIKYYFQQWPFKFIPKWVQDMVTLFTKSPPSTLTISLSDPRGSLNSLKILFVFMLLHYC